MSSKRPHEGSMSNKRQRSGVWDHFDKTPDGERAICKYCGNSLGGKSTGGTSHLKRYLKLCMKHLTGDVGQPVTLESNHEDINIGDVGQPVTLESTHEARNIGLTRDITWKDEVKKVILAEIPFASSDFKKCWYSLTGLTDIEKEICAYYEIEKEKLAIELKNLPSGVSFSLQIVKELGYISITTHFINEDFNLMRRLIGFKKLDDIRSELCIVDAIKSCISEWKLGDKTFTFIGGNDIDINDMEERLLECYSSKLLLNGKFIYNVCHKELVTNFYTCCIGPLCYQENSNIDKLVKHVKGGLLRMAIFNKLAEERGLTPINTDWLNEYAGCSWDVKSEDLGHRKLAVEMFKQAHVYKDVFNQYAEIAGPSMTVNGENSMLDNGHSSHLDNIGFSCPDTHVEVGQSPHSELNMCSINWERVEKAICFSDLMPKVIDGLSTSNYPTSNLFIPYLMQIKDIWKLLEIEQKIAYSLLGAYCDDLYYGKSDDLFEIANVLDPRYKLIFVEYNWKENGPHDWKIDEQRKFFEKIFCTYANDEMNEGSPECIENTNTQEQGSPSNSPHMIHGTTAKYHKYVKEIKKTRKSELYKYLGDELVDLDDASFNILRWWKQNRSQYPVLSRIAHDVLAVPTCVHSIEDIISSDFKLLGSASPQLVEAVICSKDWILFDVRSVPEMGN